MDLENDSEEEEDIIDLLNDMVNNAFEENDNHQSADNNVDGQNVDMADEGEHVMIMTTETVYLKDGTAISGNKVIVTWLGCQNLLLIRVFLQTFPMMLMDCIYFVISDWGCFTKPCKLNKQVCRNFSHKEERYFVTTFKIQTIERQWHFTEWNFYIIHVKITSMRENCYSSKVGNFSAQFLLLPQ